MIGDFISYSALPHGSREAAVVKIYRNEDRRVQALAAW